MGFVGQSQSVLLLSEEIGGSKAAGRYFRGSECREARFGCFSREDGRHVYSTLIPTKMSQQQCILIRTDSKITFKCKYEKMKIKKKALMILVVE